MKTRILLLSIFLAANLVVPANADIKGPKGEKCDTVETKVSHQIKGTAYICDKCVFCDTSGKEIKCEKRVTYWANCSEPEPPKKK